MFSQQTANRTNWIPWVIAIAGFWLSSNIVLDFLVMPIMYVSGMTTQTDFATAGYSLFWSFNRVELLCAAIVLTGVLALRRNPGEFEVAYSGSRCRWALGIGLCLLSLALVDTYVLTPEMSATALSLNSASQTAIAPAMNWLHSAYWLLEVLKVTSLASLVWLCLIDMRDRLAATANVSL
ncbi:DUF4149 domain-containing protein [Oscillatoria sp. CS-180]|uniref:DUF4149 domain-containing protein n=1 Tax=Oscillatoria sp. CS-180 TaxID=3021720 RepID=UPI00232C88D3|nr:DUF4149 domain-containing protein [Oscillatoria sp. CS-180]MDB9525965.1 DUF4149 domain-containing protein [Oscillatoria sp. CS-180]